MFSRVVSLRCAEVASKSSVRGRFGRDGTIGERDFVRNGRLAVEVVPNAVCATLVHVALDATPVRTIDVPALVRNDLGTDRGDGRGRDAGGGAGGAGTDRRRVRTDVGSRMQACR